MFSCELKNLIRQLCDEYFFNVVWIFDFLNYQQFLFFKIFKSMNPPQIELENGLFQLFQKTSKNQ
jgi:hypothetical protein